MRVCTATVSQVFVLVELKIYSKDLNFFSDMFTLDKWNISKENRLDWNVLYARNCLNLQIKLQLINWQNANEFIISK